MSFWKSGDSVHIMFQLTDEEFAFLRSQNAILETGRGRHRKYLPNVFILEKYCSQISDTNDTF
jgi:hypothetical protein